MKVFEDYSGKNSKYLIVNESVVMSRAVGNAESGKGESGMLF
jgi:hypothetical protein